MKSTQKTMESWVIANYKKGKTFYSEKSDSHLKAIANYYNKKIITERIIATNIRGRVLKCKYITKVTLL